MKLLSGHRLHIFFALVLCTLSVQVYSAVLLRSIRSLVQNETIAIQLTDSPGHGTPISSPSGPTHQGSTTPSGEHGGEHGGEPGGEHEESEHEPHEVHRFHVAKFMFDNVNPFILVALFIIFVLCAKILIHFHEHLCKYLPESCMLIVVGAVLGIIMYFAGAPNYQLNPHTFFLVVLPPIIFDAGYYMPVRPFFDNLGSILLYAIMGTLMSALMLGFSLYGVSQAGGFGETPEMPMLHLLTLSSLLAAVDPVAVLAVFDAVQVNEVLYIVVFGEALLNDGIAVVLYRIFDSFSEIGKENIIGQDIGFGFLSFLVVVVCSPSIGYCFAVLAGFISRFTYVKRMFEPMLVWSIGYISYVFAEMLHLSGILSATFCGIAMRKYVEHNYSNKSKAATKYGLRTGAQAAEGIIFLYIGVSCVNDDQYWNTGFILLTMAFCMVFRALSTIVLTFIGNKVRHRKLDAIDQFIMSYGGLRGAIAFALALELNPEIFPAQKLFITTTVFVVYFTNIFLGTTIEPIVTMLRVARKSTHKPTMNGKIAERVCDYTMAGIESIAGHIPIIQSYYNIKLKFSDWHTKYIKPLIVGKNKELPGTHRGFEIRNIYMKLSEKDARQLVKTPSFATDISRLGSYIRRQNSASDLSRVGTETNLFNPALWSLPSFSLDERQRVGLDNQISSEEQTRQGNLNNVDPAKYAKHYKRRNIVSSASSQYLAEPDNDLNVNLEPSVRYRKNIGHPTDSDIGNDQDWHQQSSAIEFVIGAKTGDSSASYISDPSDKHGYVNEAFSPDNELRKPGNKNLSSINHADGASKANSSASSGCRNQFSRSGSYDDLPSNYEVPQRNKSGSLDAGAMKI